MHERAAAREAHGGRRDGWLDWLRAGAIVSVMIYHVLQMSTGARYGWEVARYGYLGVDLFFVLSGWLIGGLYFREHGANGRVALLRFWQRRWWRTIPPYCVALLLSWAAVRVARHEPFDFGYLIFAQNYYQRLPFFLVSWSLCIEEHFYLFVPLIVSITSRLRAPLHGVFGSLMALSIVSRWLVVDAGHAATAFGFYETATHLRLDGLVLGFWASAVAADPVGNAYERLRRVARWALPIIAGWFVWTAVIAEPRVRYVWQPTSAGLCFLALLLARVGGRSDSRALQPAYPLAIAAYSLYLTHPLAIHVARLVAQRFAAGAAGVYYGAAVLLIASFGAGFFVLVERPSTRLREHWAPKRKAVQADSAALV
jgi:peptidoglycan/LPS O-acetylase OafA/YrhL